MIAGDFSSRMKPDNDICQVARQVGREPARFGESVDEISLRKSLHLQHPIENDPIPAKGQIVTQFAGDGAKAKIEGRSVR